jgi:hypothetical protein
MVVRGKYYPGGMMVPDLSPPVKTTTGRRSKLRDWFKSKRPT